MPNWAYLLVTLVYNLALAVWIGGAIALGALAAPTMFGGMERSKAGELFGAILRKFARLRLAALVFAIAAAGVKYFFWESRAGAQHGLWVALRWSAMVIMAVAVLYEILYLESALERHRPESAGTTFQKLHRRAEMVLSGLGAAGNGGVLKLILSMGGSLTETQSIILTVTWAFSIWFSTPRGTSCRRSPRPDPAMERTDPQFERGSRWFSYHLRTSAPEGSALQMSLVAAAGSPSPVPLAWPVPAVVISSSSGARSRGLEVRACMDPRGDRERCCCAPCSGLPPLLLTSSGRFSSRSAGRWSAWRSGASTWSRRQGHRGRGAGLHRRRPGGRNPGGRRGQADPVGSWTSGIAWPGNS